VLTRRNYTEIIIYYCLKSLEITLQNQHLDNPEIQYFSLQIVFVFPYHELKNIYMVVTETQFVINITNIRKKERLRH